MKEPFRSYKKLNPAIREIVFFLLLFALMLSGIRLSFAAAQIPVKRVLIIYGLNPNYPAHQLFTKGLQDVFKRSSDKFQIEYSFEYLDLGLGRADENYRAVLAKFLKRKYLLKSKPDLIFAHLTPANTFLVKYADEIIPGVPVVFTGDQPGMIPVKDIPSNFAGIVREGNPAPAVSLILQAQPDTRKIYIVLGDSPHERESRLAFAKDLASFSEKVEIIYLNHLPFPQMMETIKGIRGPSVILFINYIQDVAKNDFVPARVSGIISRAANVPTYGSSAVYMGQGVVGGYQFSAGVVGERAAELGTKVLLGSRISDFPREQTAATAEYRFDWRALKRWGIDERRLPRESKFEYRSPTLWDSYKWQIIGGIILVLVETFLILLLLVNIKKRKKGEEVLRESEEQYHTLFENAGEAIFVAQDNKVVFVNPMTVTITGYSGEELAPRPFVDFIHTDDRDMVIDRHGRRLKGESIPPRYSFRILHKNGGFRWVELDAVMIKWKGRTATLNFMADITERRRTDEEIQKANTLLNSIVENIPNMIFLKDARELRFTRFNRAGEELLGHFRGDLLGKNDYDLFPKEQADFFTEKDREVLRGKEIVEIQEESIQTRNKGERILHTKKVPILNANGEPEYLMGISEDITDLKRAEEKAKESDALLRIAGEKAKLGGWSVNLEENRVTWSDEVAAIHEMPNGYSPSVEQGISFYAPEWHERITKVFTDCSQKGIPYDEELEIVTAGGKRVWVKTIGEAVKDKAGKIVKVQGAFQDITNRKQAEEKLKETLGIIRKSIGVTIQMLVSAIEVRDPYTAGHQKRVADIARAIATEMGLNKDKIEGIRMAGSIHDIGKLSIPSEILTKPTRLTDLEFSLIKGHSESGYEMLMNVESPWPLAQIVYQHHERMDGSGYPRRLKGDEIIIEARIMAVADVVEAMASHRPYRPGLGLDAALEEIEKNKGIAYDPDVVDACLKLFREKGYQLK